MIKRNNLKGKQRIIVVTSTFPRWEGDADPPFVYELAKRLCDDYDITILAPHYPGTKIRETMSGMNVVRHVYCLPVLERLVHRGGILSNLKKYPLMVFIIPLFFLSQLWSLLHLVRKLRPEIIHAHWLIPQGIIAVFAILLAGKSSSLICTSHGGDLYGLHQTFFKSIRKFIYCNANKFTVVSNAMKKFLIKEGCSEKLISVIPMGVDSKHRFIPSSNRNRNNRVLLFVGRLVEKKGTIYLIHAMPEVLRYFPDAKLIVIGDGPERDRCKFAAKQLGIWNQIAFLGAISNEKLPSIYGNADIVIFPSVIDQDGDQEGFGLVLVEAMACGCAVICTELEAMLDIVKDGDNGLVVPQKNVESLSKAIKKLLGDDQLRKRLINRGLYTSGKFDWDVIAERYRNTFDLIIDKSFK